ncbi:MULTISPECIES: hypothetical protein [Pseudomonas]|uniref:hypothetical protein n=1 Tax=Pseudomonas TaxID=286 RepID=UPI000C86ABB9|nr:MULTISPECIES: hypothetical protein [Pseudomonas]PMV20780.1 hypothetical protein C1X17_19840 [Pseudomonas sp. FW305-3-2-15-C-TSA2]PMV25593.1 hypothetical protein C1X22_20160 [Pseudomonas sp. DP16D-L5]PMV36931.1 hypothetical protein C1X21_21960 [Pseudomonas sp. FW305-3-2-15-A-LB2]PMV43116.1 hypothetical protein C1X16_21845 [Pseudomonas sp. FW305-3-2-15-C-R2A1]PMV49902.1 hypothetical protein C1X18_18545 [Pseudomonas sp. FW305-3-2-15-C-LB1]
MIEPWEKSRTPKLKNLLKQLADHTPSNPDDDPNLTGEEFLSATDDKTRELVGQIVDHSQVALFDNAGRKQGQSCAAITRAGNRVSVVGDPNDEDDRNKTTLQIETEHGVLTLDSPLVGR